MDILYTSTLCSKEFLKYLFSIANKKPTYSIQKFHRLLAQGLIATGCNVTTNTSIPASRKSYSKYIFNRKSEFETGIKYTYRLCINLKFLKNIVDFLFSFFFTLGWCLRQRKGVVICDVLNVSVCLASLLATKILGNHSVAIVTDMPGLMVGSNNSSKNGFVTKVMFSYINSFDGYILLTEQMNERINLNKRPYIIMEGLVDSNMKEEKREQQLPIRTIIYAGGLHERYGLKMLVDAFNSISIDYKDVELHLYGAGPFVPYIERICEQNHQIIFHGAVENDEVVNAELKATLLVNPRPTHEDFTRYSFPSKNMEYMVSGTPVLTTKLPGMPKDYYPYVFFVREETTNGFEKALREILAMPNSEIIKVGKEAKEFVLHNKNNIFQGSRIVNFLNNLP